MQRSHCTHFIKSKMLRSLRFINSFHEASFQIFRIKKGECFQNTLRMFRTSSALQIREVVEKTEGNVTVVEGKVHPSPRTEHMLDVNGPDDLCVLCKLNMDIKYTDVMILSQFMQEDGQIIPRQVTKLCYAQHARLKRLIHQAHTAGLMQNLRPAVFPEEYSQKSDVGWKKYNVYYLEGTDEAKAK